MDFIFTTSEWIANKKIYPTLRLFLNSIFCISIATFTYSHCYPEQTSILKDAQVSLLGWFVDGNFFLPIVMILLVWLSTWFIGVLVWYTFRWFLSRSLRKKIYAFEIGRQDVVGGLFTARKLIHRFTSRHFTQVEITQFYAELKTALTEEELNEIEEILQKGESEIHANFYLLVRMAIAMSIYFFWLPYFSFWLFITLLIIIIVLMLIMLLTGLAITIVPDFASKADQIIQQFLNNELPKRLIN